MKSNKVVMILFGILIVLLIPTQVVGIFALVQNMKVQASIEDLKKTVSENTYENPWTSYDDPEDPYDPENPDGPISYGETAEDDVTIAGEYVIRSTKAISDAYKSKDTSALDDKQKETLDMATAILADIIKDGMSDFEKEKAVYEWMTANLVNDSGVTVVIPTTQQDCDNPYGVLKYHNAVCVGYATTFRMFMQMMDIECMVVHNAEEYHSWDLVKLDGNWYHTDIYSDAGVGSYANFNLNDSMMSNGQSWDTSFFPEATSLEYNMAYQNKVELKEIAQFAKDVRTSLENGGGMLSYELTKEQIENGFYQQFLYLETLIETRIASTEEYGYCYTECNLSELENGGVLAVVNMSIESDTVDVPDEDREMLDQIIEDNFGDLTQNSYGGYFGGYIDEGSIETINGNDMLWSTEG